MPSAWTLIDTSFPTFTGKEKVKEQIPVILNYMYMLSEGLKYQLSNLNNSNWNSTALDDLKIETTAELVEQMKSVTEQITTIFNRLNSLNAQILQAEMNIGELEKNQQTLEKTMEDFSSALSSLEGAMMQLEEAFQEDDSGNITIGKSGKNLNFVGSIYVNGKLLE